MNKTAKRYLIVDCLSFLPEGQDLYAALARLTDETVQYIDAASLNNITGYRLFLRAKRFWRNKVCRNRALYCTVSKKTTHLKQKIIAYNPTHIIWVGFSFPVISSKAVMALKQSVAFKSVLIDIDINTLMNSTNQQGYYFREEAPRHDKILMLSKVISHYIKQTQKTSTEIVFFPAFATTEPQTKPAAKEVDVLFYGVPSLRRVVVLNSIANHPVTVVGKTWGNTKTHEDMSQLLHRNLQKRLKAQDVWQQALANLIHRSKIILNISRVIWFNIESGITVRTYQVLAHGGFLLTEYCQELEETLTPGKDVETYRDMEELNDKIAFYLKHDDARNKIAAQGHQTFLTYHTTDKRAAQLLTQMTNI